MTSSLICFRAVSPKKRHKQSKTQETKSPSKVGGTGENYKSKEFISSSDSDSEKDSDEEPLKKSKSQSKEESDASSDTGGSASDNDASSPADSA